MRPFAGDNYIAEEFKRLAKKFNIDYVIETGTYEGSTTEFLATVFKKVYTIELKDTYGRTAQKRLGNKENVLFLSGSSPYVMDKILPQIKKQRPLMFFLDAHWYGYNPLLDELNVIARYGLKDSIIAIHDFKVPGKNFGYDSYKDITYKWRYINGVVKKIYGNDFEYYYNKKAQGAKRGIVYIVPKT